MSSYNAMTVLVVEIAIFAFAFYRANKNDFSITVEGDLNNPVGAGATFTFWYLFLNSLFFAVVTENVLPLAPAALLWFIRLKLKQE